MNIEAELDLTGFDTLFVLRKNDGFHVHESAPLHPQAAVFCGGKKLRVSYRTGIPKAISEQKSSFKSMLDGLPRVVKHPNEILMMGSYHHVLRGWFSCLN